MTRIFLLTIAILFTSSAAFAQEVSYDPGKPLATTPWYEWMNAEEKMADMHFITHMRPHHAGALSMSEEYLSDPKAKSPRLERLAHGIIANQTFEIGVLDYMKKLLGETPIAKGETKLIRSASQGLAQSQRYVFNSIPSLVSEKGSASARDVKFAKAMIVHHEGAVDMCKGYINNPAADNGYLKGMCRDIVVGQTQEIELMHDIIADYDGNPDAIKIKNHMIHGMDHMMHGKDANKEFVKSREKHGR